VSTAAPEGPTPILLPRAFLAYRCNLQGCCCGGWGVTWTPDDLGRLARLLPRDELEELFAADLQLVLDDDGRSVLAARLRASIQGGRCRFLDEGVCGLQRRFGVEALPGICADFPVVPYSMEDRVELSYRLVCPGVMDCLFASDGPMDFAELGAPDAMFASRLQRVGAPPELRLSGAPVSLAALTELRAAVLSACNRRELPLFELVAQLETGFAELWQPSDLAAFAPRAPADPEPFARYFFDCMGLHSAQYLLDNLRRCSRFVFHLEEGRREALLATLSLADLDSWPQGIQRYLEPAEPLLRAPLQRYLWAQYASCFVHLQGNLRYSLGSVGHELAVALRYLLAFCQAEGRPADRGLLQLALTAAVHLFHTRILPVASEPWFGGAPSLGPSPTD